MFAEAITNGELIQIGSILALCGLTGWYSVETRRIAHASKDAAVAAQQSAESAERLLQLETIPIVWAHAGKRLQGEGNQGWVRLEVHNSGRGAALRVRCSVTTDDGDVFGPELIVDALDPIVGRDQKQVSMPNRFVAHIERGEYTLSVSYTDAAGKLYTTRGSPGSGEILERSEYGVERTLFGA